MTHDMALLGFLRQCVAFGPLKVEHLALDDIHQANALLLHADGDLSGIV